MHVDSVNYLPPLAAWTSNARVRETYRQYHERGLVAVSVQNSYQHHVLMHEVQRGAHGWVIINPQGHVMVDKYAVVALVLAMRDEGVPINVRALVADDDDNREAE